MQSLTMYQLVIKTKHPLNNLRKGTMAQPGDHPVMGCTNMSYIIHTGRDRTTQNHNHGDLLLQNKEGFCNLGLFPKIMIA